MIERCAWRRWVLRLTRSHIAAFVPVYLADRVALNENLGAYHGGKIWIAKELEGCTNQAVLEVLHHELFHAKFERAKSLGVKFKGLSVEAAVRMAGCLASQDFHSKTRQEIIQHYRVYAGPSFDEECLVQMCCAVMFGEKTAVPAQLRSFCEALSKPFCLRPTFMGGFIGSAPHCFRGVGVWPEDSRLPGGGLSRGAAGSY